MDGSSQIEIRQDLLQQSSYKVYLPLFSSGIVVFYVGVYILRYYWWRIKQRRRKIRLLEYEKLRWLWHQKQLRLHYQAKEEKTNLDMDDEQDAVNIAKYSFSRPSSSVSMATIHDHRNKNDIKMKDKRNQQNKCDYGDDSAHCREPSLMVTIPSPAYQPSDDYHSHSKPRLTNQKSSQLHHYHQHQHQHSSSSSASSSSTRKVSSPGQGSFYSSSSSTTTLACSCIQQQHRCKKESNPATSPCLTSFSDPTSPSSSEGSMLYYPNQEKRESLSHPDVSFGSIYDKKTTPTTKVPSRKNMSPTYWPFYDTKAKRTRMIWKWSVAMGYCHYDHAKLITSIIDQLDPPPC